MRRILFFLLIVPLFVACKSNEEKIQDLIREQMFQTLYDYKSYEPIDMSDITEEIHSLYNDSAIIMLVKEHTEGEKMVGHAFKNKVEDIFYEVLNSRRNVLFLTGELDQPFGYSVIHRFRAKNKGGVYNIYTKKYLIDKNLERIIWEYTIDEEDKVKKNVAHFINRWNEALLSKQINMDFLEENKKKDGVITTESGLQYKIIRQGKGAIPTEMSKVKVDYLGKLIDGKEFDSSYKRKFPAVFRLDQVIKGWTEALTMMPVGSKWEIYIPQELGYGSRSSGKIKAYSTLIFEIELLGIEK